jgi:hypothetical protein
MVEDTRDYKPKISAVSSVVLPVTTKKNTETVHLFHTVRPEMSGCHKSKHKIDTNATYIDAFAS